MGRVLVVIINICRSDGLHACCDQAVLRRKCFVTLSPPLAGAQIPGAEHVHEEPDEHAKPGCGEGGAVAQTVLLAG